MSHLLLSSSPMWAPPKFAGNKIKQVRNNKIVSTRRVSTSACLINPFDDPIIKEVVKEPVAFMGGMFAGLLRLDLNEEPLKEWMNRTVEASGITEEDVNTQAPEEAAPQQIDIE